MAGDASWKDQEGREDAIQAGRELGRLDSLARPRGGQAGVVEPSVGLTRRQAYWLIWLRSATSQASRRNQSRLLVSLSNHTSSRAYLASFAPGQWTFEQGPLDFPTWRWRWTQEAGFIYGRGMGWRGRSCITTHTMTDSSAITHANMAGYDCMHPAAMGLLLWQPISQILHHTRVTTIELDGSDRRTRCLQMVNIYRFLCNTHGQFPRG